MMQLVTNEIVSGSKDIIAGSIAGVGLLISGYPFDTVKVRMQLHNTSVLGCLKQLRGEGYSSFFSGINYPFKAIPLANAVLFYSYEIYRRFTNTTELSWKQGFYAGSFAGVMNSFVMGPVELIKCRMQDQNHLSNSRQCLQRLIKLEGFKGLLNGMFATIVREIPCCAVQFAIYEYMKVFYYQKNGIQKLSMLQSFLVGILTGVGAWGVSYPQDLIKTKLQVQRNRYKINRFIPDDGFFDCTKEIYRKSGMRGFFYGMTPCLINMGWANGFLILIYEQMKNKLNE